MVKMMTGHGEPVTLYDSTDTEIGTTASPLKVSGTVTESAPAATTVAPNQLTVSATQVLLLPQNSSRLGATIGNTIPSASTTIFIGPTGVTAANGFPLAPGSAYNIDFPNVTAAIYGITASGQQLVGIVDLT